MQKVVKQVPLTTIKDFLESEQKEASLKWILFCLENNLFKAIMMVFSNHILNLQVMPVKMPSMITIVPLSWVKGALPQLVIMFRPQ